MSLGKKPSNESASSSFTEMSHSHSFQSIFASENSEQAKEMIINSIRQEITRRHSQAASDSGSDDFVLPKHEPAEPSMPVEKSKRKPTMLLAGPRFRYHTIEPTSDFKRETLYPISASVAEVELACRASGLRRVSLVLLRSS